MRNIDLARLDVEFDVPGNVETARIGNEWEKAGFVFFVLNAEEIEQGKKAPGKERKQPEPAGRFFRDLAADEDVFPSLFPNEVKQKRPKVALYQEKEFGLQLFGPAGNEPGKIDGEIDDRIGSGKRPPGFVLSCRGGGGDEEEGLRVGFFQLDEKGLRRFDFSH